MQRRLDKMPNAMRVRRSLRARVLGAQELISRSASIEPIAHLGVVRPLFMIGLEAPAGIRAWYPAGHLVCGIARPAPP